MTGSTPILSKEFTSLVHEEEWTLPSHSTRHLSDEKWGFEINSPDRRLKTTWMAGLQLNENGVVGFSLTLKEKDEAFPSFSSNWSLYASSSTTSNCLELHNEFLQTTKTAIDQEMYLNFKCNIHQYVEMLLFSHPFGLRVQIVITLQILKDVEEELLQNSGLKLRENFARLLAQAENADLKIVCSDGVELQAHQNIVKAQNSVFESMLRSEMSESQTGVINVDDLCGNTMKILLHFFYTGELLPGWKNPEIIHEFVYASGKYQLTDVLQMLDSVLGTEKVSTCDVQLLTLVNKLGLEKADVRVSEKLGKLLCQAKGGTQFLEILGKLE